LVPAGATLGYGGDSGLQAGFTCIAAGQPRVIQRAFELIGPTEYGAWLETDTAYSWHGAKLIRLSKRTFRRHGYLKRSEIEVGSGCGPVS
jgi:hypothetical protein